MLAGVVADDLTGALEMGAMLAGSCLRSFVTIGCRDLRDDFDAVVVDTETRNQSPECAAFVVFNATRSLRAAGVQRLFKKIDSTLRGPIGAELQAVREAWGGSIVLTPAYPRLGRAVCNGRLFAG